MRHKIVYSLIMTEISFYQVKDETPAAVDNAVARLLEKIIQSNTQTLIRCTSMERTERLSNNIWSVKESAFIPHGTSNDAYSTHQPIYLTHKEENPNNAEILITLSGAQSADFSTFLRVLDIFDASENAIKSARTRWKSYKEKGYPLKYYAYENGRWVNKA